MLYRVIRKVWFLFLGWKERRFVRRISFKERMRGSEENGVEELADVSSFDNLYENLWGFR